MDANQRSVKSNPAALLPIGVFLVLYLGCGLLFEYGLKIEQGFYQTPAIVIFLIALETREGVQIKHLTPGSKPQAVFALAQGDSVVSAYAYCNLHGLWKA